MKINKVQAAGNRKKNTIDHMINILCGNIYLMAIKKVVFMWGDTILKHEN